MTIGTSTTATLSGGGSGHRSILYTQALLASGTLDLTNNDLDLQAGGSAGLAAITVLVNHGMNAGSSGPWTGTGITSSSAAGDNSHLTALGVAPAVTSSIDGLPASTGDVLVKYTYYGDANLDGKVDGSDYSRIDSAYLADQSNATAVTGWYNGDFNYDGIVNGSDYTLIDNAFNTQGALLAATIASPTASVTDQIAAVPEPNSLALSAFAAAGILSRRKKLVGD